MNVRAHLTPTLALLLVALCVPLGAAAQEPVMMAMHASAPRDSLSLMLTALGTRVGPALNGRARSDLQVTQPMITFRATRASAHIRLAAMLNFERWTMPGGEPVPGIWGEGFIDRRHPHTVLHEVMLTGVASRGRIQASLAGGKGFVPFGTDDPMVRPFTKYPANHHLSQVMERIQLVSALRLSPRLAIEAGVFNGDEPLSPTAGPQWRRFGDSRAARITVWPSPTVEVQGSLAAVRSPEFLRPDGLDHDKRSVSLRWTPSAGALRYAQVEWARTEEAYRDRPIIAYGSALAEASWRLARWSLAARAEQTTRPEDERLLDPFRTSRPPNHLQILGMTRWRIATLQVGRDVTLLRRTASEFLCGVSYANSSPLLRPVLLDPRNISGADVAWHLAFGLRLSRGAMSARTGRYGVGAGGKATDRMLGMAHSLHTHEP